MLFGKLFAKKAIVEDYRVVSVDIHSHFIPGVDDGAKSLADAVEMIKRMRQLGFEKIVTTPHIMSEYYPNNSVQLLEGLEYVRAALLEAQISVDISCAAEYFMDEHFVELVEKNDLLTLWGNYVLVEMSFFAAPQALFTYLFRLQSKGYRPVLAHPERYIYYRNNLAAYEKLKSVGCKFQLNILSLMGHYGKVVQDNASFLLKNKLIDYLGTDAHKIGHIDILYKERNHPLVQKALTEYPFLNRELHFS